MDATMTLRGGLAAVACISAGASIGALMRWALGIWLNRLFPLIPPGTVAANFIASFALGLALAFFSANGGIPAHWRLMVITGFCGGLSTFSTFSGEVLFLLQQGRYLHAGLGIGLHLCGTVLLVLAGMVCYSAVSARF